MKRLAVAVCTMLLWLCSALAAAAELRIEKAYPVLGEDLAVRLVENESSGGVTLWAVYRPNSATSVEKEIGPLPADGVLHWRPEAPGITTLLAKGPEGKNIASKNVATRYGSPPISGIAVMLLAGVLLFGGAVGSLGMARRS